MFCMNPPLSQGGEGGWWWRGARLSSWHQSPVSRGKCLLIQEVSTLKYPHHTLVLLRHWCRGSRCRQLGSWHRLILWLEQAWTRGWGWSLQHRGLLTLLARHGHRTPAALLSPGYRVTITEWTLASTTCTTCTDK